MDRRHETTGAWPAGALAVLLTVVLLATLAACGSSSGPKALKGTSLSGEPVDLAAYRGKPVVINFFASWCGPCNMEAPEVAAFAKAHPEVTVIGVDTNDTQADGQGFVSKYGLGFPVVADPDGALAQDWGVGGIPTTFFVNKDGVVKDHVVGASTSAAFESKLKQLY
jgi:DsbE subfamily thiol:disulfide oxidoreductase